ncbi:TonB family protein [Rudanella paleaurantiibacter]|uniref:TonB family protein n=1 Tax=Rudanella paleaurantiibacter TaxID=2614655 RepID=A0A7J5U4V8_9BACT|nr:energy transducer TonB [Rudanella paleaurantiibacter]KAB7732878.1 TonB family protein [Rudanella paleaurantiibacter]
MTSRLILTLCFCLIRLTVSAQSTAYADYEVDQPAEPGGGQTWLDKFMSTNVRKPFLAQVANVKGLVVVQGVVEPNGRITEVTVLKSLRPDCDREAVRAFSLFNAWKPALKKGQPVRQRVTAPVYFHPNEPVDYQNGLATWHFDTNLNRVAPTDPEALYRSQIPTDTLGLPTGDLQLFKRKEGQWKTETTIALSTEPFRGGTLLIHRMPNQSGFGPVYQLSKDGRILAEYVQGPDGTVGLRLDRDERGMVVKSTEQLNGYYIVTEWYPSGQIKQMWSHAGLVGNVRIVYASKTAILPSQAEQPSQLLALWDSTGHQQIMEGRGKFSRQLKVNSGIRYRQQVELIEEGEYENGRMQGYWQTAYADGSCWNRQYYDKGVLQHERFWTAGYPDTLTFHPTDHPPMPMGGFGRLNGFLAHELRPLTREQLGGVQGYVLVSFQVNTYGRATDIRVAKSLHPAADREALRVVRLMNRQRVPFWLTAYQNGLPVKAASTLPIHFVAD